MIFRFPATAGHGVDRCEGSCRSSGTLTLPYERITMLLMRTTLTLDDDVERELREAARRSGRPFKEIVNEALRRGLLAGSSPARRSSRFRVRPTACGFRAGIDLTKLNQLLDDLEIEHAGVLVVRDR